MTDAGQLRIALSCSADKVEAVNIQSTRPLHISRLFIGKTPQQTLAILPLLFNVCGIAQAFAAHTACSRALGLAENYQATQARQLLLNVEIVREHCWWLLLERDKARIAPFLQLLPLFKQALFVQGDAFSLNSQLHVPVEKVTALIQQVEQALDAVFAGQRLSYLALRDETALQQWLENNASIAASLLREVVDNQQQRLGRTALALLPKLSDCELLAQLNQHNAAEFSRYPSWQGQRYETSCLNRQQQQPLIANLLQQYGNGLLTRLASRLCELANMPTLLRQNLLALQNVSCHAATVNPTNLAQIQASRGLLIHRVELKNAIIANYQIIAPTEWNFQPNGVAALSLQQLSASNKTTLQQQAAMLIQAIDPCVGFDITINSE